MRKIGFLLDDLSPSQLAYDLLTSCHRALHGRRQELDVVIFTRNPGRPCVTPPCSVMTWREAWAYDGLAVACNAEAARYAAGFPQAPARIHYLHDLEWLRNRQVPYRDWAGVYQNPRLRLACRSESHAELVRGLWGPAVVVPRPDPLLFLSLDGDAQAL